MKKNKTGIIAFVLSLVLIAVAVPVFAASGLILGTGASGNASGNASGEPVEIALGELDGTAGISAEDARIALRMAVRLDLPTPQQAIAADVDDNGKIEAADARLILRASVKLEPEFGTISVILDN